MGRELAITSGSKHLVGGQVLDLEGENNDISARPIKIIQQSKTAALLTSSLKLGAMSAGATDKKVQHLEEFGQCTGLAFQVIDDILDVTQSSETLGKSAGKDEAVNKATYPAIHGLDKSKRLAEKLTKQAINALKPFKSKGKRLEELANYLLDREY